MTPKCRLENALATTTRAISDERREPAFVPSALLIAIATGIAGASAAFYYSHAGLALTHYDARAHLVVARRILDSLMPGWQQIGAVWLPLPHVLNMLPVQFDAWYRTGASAIAISVMSMAIGAWALASLIVRRTGSIAAACAGAALLLANPNVLYLQSTPMTEPLLFGTTLLAVALTANWIDDGVERTPHAAGLAIAAACMTRYEAWPICGALFALTLVVLLRRGLSIGASLTAVSRLACYPALAIAIFLLNSRWTVGAWFISGGFFVAENEARGHPLLAWQQVHDGVFRLSGSALVWPAYAAVVVIVWTFARSKARASLALVMALVASAALPWYAYFEGHPFRIRYGVPLVVACAALIATGIGLLPRRLRDVVAALAVAASLWQVSPLDSTLR